MLENPDLIIASSTVADGNMSFTRGNPKEALINREKWLNSLGIKLSQIVTIQLEHGTKTIRVGKENLGKAVAINTPAPLADGLITNEKGIYLFIIIADCIGLTLFNPQTSAIGLVHAGREGLLKGVLTTAVSSMQANYNCDPQQLLAQFSPSLGPCCYKPVYLDQTPPEVLKHVVHNQGEPAIDIWSWAEEQLLEAGLLKENIFNPKVCTCHTDQYFSHRQTENDQLPHDYRFATLTGLKP